MHNITKLVLMRHGESEWNKENRFTGWVDIDLSEQGRIEAENASKILKDNSFVFDYGYTSMLKRAIRTLWIILDHLDQLWLPINKSWYLNERHYGMLQGLNKNEAIKKYGYNKIQQWRRSFNVTPPPYNKIINDKNHRHIGTDDIRYKNIHADFLPNGESLEITMKRVVLYWNNVIIPKIKNNKIIIIVAHGNSIRSIIKFLNNLSAEEIFKINIPTGSPLVYEFDKNANPVKNYYL